MGTGVTKDVAQTIASACGCDVEEIMDARPRKGMGGYWRSAYEALTGKTPAIGPTKANPADYELTIIGTPVWAGNVASPVRAYMTQHKDRFNGIATFCTIGGSGGEKALATIAALADRRPAAQPVLSATEIIDAKCRERIVDFAKDLSSFQTGELSGSVMQPAS